MSKRSEPNGGSHAQDPTLTLSDSQILSAVDKRTPPPPPAQASAASRNADHSMWLGRVVVSEEFAPQGTKRKRRFLRAPMWMVIGAIVVGSSAGAGLYFVTHGGMKGGAEPTSSAGPVTPPAPAPTPSTPTPAVPPPTPAAPAAPAAGTSLTEAPKPAPKPTVRKRSSKSAKASASKKKSKKSTAAAAKKRKAAKSSRTRSR